MPTADRLTSPTSDRVKAVRALHERTGRRRAGRFVVEGPQGVRAALIAAPDRVVPREVFVREDCVESFADVVAGASDASVRVSVVPERVFAALGQAQHPQGVLAVCDLLPAVAVEAVMADDGPVVLLDSLGDPGNVGTIIRTAAAAGAAGVVLTPTCADVHNGKVVRSTAGTMFAVPLVTDCPSQAALAAAHAAGRTVVVTAGDAPVDLFDAVRDGRIGSRPCWVIGSEAHGVGDAARAAADQVVRIPMAAGPESLNAAAAAATVLFVAAYASSGAGPAGCQT